MATSLSGKFKKEEREYDGLSDPDIRRMILDRPLETYVAVTVLQPITKQEDFRDGTVTPTVRVQRIEVVLAPDDIKAVLALLDARYKERTGRDVPADLFTDADPDHHVHVDA